MTRRRGIWIVAALLLCVAAGTRADSVSPADQFAAGNGAFEEGDYQAAVDRYLTVADAGIRNADLFYNLGNAYFELGEMGHAVLWYERARRLDPRDDDIAANLDFTRSLLQDKQLIPTEGAVRRAAMAWHRGLSLDESLKIASALYALCCVLIVLFVLRREPRVDAFLRRMSVVSPGRLFGLGPGPDVMLAIVVTLVAGGLFAGSTWAKVRAERDRTRGVVVATEVSVFSGPSRDATVQFRIHEGTGLSVREARPGWFRVELPGDLSGWVDAGTLERI
jgi:hypothetical protein